MCVDAHVRVHACMPVLVVLYIHAFTNKCVLSSFRPSWPRSTQVADEAVFPYVVGILCVLSILVASTLYVTLIVH